MWCCRQGKENPEKISHMVKKVSANKIAYNVMQVRTIGIFLGSFARRGPSRQTNTGFDTRLHTKVNTKTYQNLTSSEKSS